MQFHSGCNAANAHVGSLVVVIPEPFRCLILCRLNSFKDVLAQPFTANGAIEALNVGVQLGFAWLDMCKPNTLFSHLFHQCPADIFWAIIDMNGLRFAAPLDDLVQAPHDALGGQREVDFDAKTSAIKEIQHVLMCGSTDRLPTDLP